MLDLLTVVPVYNERDSLPAFLDEWLHELRATGINFKILIVDGGSTDGSVELIQEYQRHNNEVLLEVRKPLAYGPSCLLGYRMAVDLEADWLLQVDSDGQCDPAYFKDFWRLRSTGKAVQGLRHEREDGFSRLVVSKLLSVMVFLLSGKYVSDLNVPYRLMDRDTLANLIPLIPPDFVLANILLSYLYCRFYTIEWVPIVFRKRTAGHTTWNLRKIFNAALSVTAAFMTMETTLKEARLKLPDR